MSIPHQIPQDATRRRRAGAAALTAIALPAAVLLVLELSPGLHATAAPAEAPTSQPTTAEMPDDGYPGQFGPRPDEFTSEHWDAIMQMLDGSQNSNEDAFYILIENVEKLSEAAVRDAPTVTYEQLMADPKRYRARPVKMSLQYMDTQESVTARPSRIARVFETRAFVARSRTESDAVVIRSRFPPPDMGPNRHFQVVGYFYKIERFPTRNDGPLVEVPVIIAYKITPGTGGEGAGLDSRALVMMGLLIVLVVLWILIRFGLARRRARGGSVYRPRRFEMTESEIEQSRLMLDEDEPGSGQPPGPGGSSPPPPGQASPPRGPQP